MVSRASSPRSSSETTRETISERGEMGQYGVGPVPGDLVKMVPILAGGDSTEESQKNLRE